MGSIPASILPTASELGFPGMTVRGSIGLLAPARTPSSPLLIAEIEARSHTRVLLKHQFEVMFGFSPDDLLSQPERHERLMKASRHYMVDSFAQLEVYIIHLCLQHGYFAPGRVLSLYGPNVRYLEGLCRMRKSGHFLDPLHDQLLKTIGYECP